ncbi:MAG TPA: hypothetical protein VGA92_05455 [Candidatus Nitrosotenuis sp.]
MCARDHDDSFRRGRKKMVFDKKEDEFEAHFKTSMLFTKSMKSL